MTPSEKSSSNEKKKLSEEQKLQEILRQPEQPANVKEDESSSSSEEKVEDKSTSAKDLEREAKVKKRIVKDINSKVKFDNHPEDVLDCLRNIWFMEDQYNVISNEDRLRLIKIGINTVANENLYVLRKKLAEYIERLGKEGTLESRKTWSEVEEDLEILLDEYAKAKVFMLPSIKNCYNDWTVWLGQVFVAIEVTKEYTLNRLRTEITRNFHRYPDNWMNIKWDENLGVVYKQLWRTSQKKTI
ncbi:hypothetical protein NEAUS03_1617, partial [Nematocida ausubeli]